MKPLRKRILISLLLFGMLTGVGCTDPSEQGGESGTTGGESDSTPSSEAPKLQLPESDAKYQLLYNSDMTNLRDAVTGNPRGALSPSLIERSVREAAEAGADAFIMAPGYCWVPWWPSQYLEEHEKWYIEEFGGEKRDNTVNLFYNYVHSQGHDLIGEHIDACRKHDIAAFISFRVNDHHFLPYTTPDKTHIGTTAEIFVEHPEYQIGYDANLGVTLDEPDFINEEIRENRLKLIGELISLYEIDGFELDFCRFYHLFNTTKSTQKEREDLMTAFVAEVASMLEEAEKRDGRERMLSVRIPAYTEVYPNLGIDIERWYEAGVDMFNLSSSYYTDQTTDIAEVRALAPEADLYYELTFASSYQQLKEPYANRRMYRRTTPEMLLTTAALAYVEGADGVSLFNFQYYREARVKEEGVATEPPWETLGVLTDRKRLAETARHYFIGTTPKERITTSWELPQVFGKGLEAIFTLNLLDPAGETEEYAVLRIKSDGNDLTTKQYRVTVNGTVVSETEDIGDPFNSADYPQLLGTAANRKCFLVPVSALKKGENEIRVEQTSGATVTINFIDLIIGAK